MPKAVVEVYHALPGRSFDYAQDDSVMGKGDRKRRLADLLKK